MRRIQLYIENDIDDALSTAAARRGLSRSAIVRDAVRSALADELEARADPLDALVGSVDVKPDRDLDAVIYTVEALIQAKTGKHLIEYENLDELKARLS